MKEMIAAHKAKPKTIGKGYVSLFPFLIMAAIAAAYANSFSVPFVYDDKSWILANRSIQQLLPSWPPESRWITELTFSINYRLHRFHPAGYHVFNLAIHAGAALFFYGILRRTLSGVMTPSAPTGRIALFSLFAALLWGLHPLNTESVTYIVQRHESLMGFFGLMAFYFFVRSILSNRPVAWQGGAALAYLLGLGCKEVVVTVPAVFFLYEYVFVSASKRRERIRNRTGFYILLMVCTFSIWPSAVYLLGASGETVSAGLGLKGVTPLEYAALQPEIIARYVKLALWPQPLNIHYYIVETSTVRTFLWGSVLAGALFYGCLALKRNKPAGFLILSFFLFLMPTSSFMPLKDAAAEHRMYLALTLYAAGVTALLLGSFLREGPNPLSVTRKLLICAGCLYVLSLSFLTYARNLDYQDEIVLWEQSLALQPNNPRAHNSAALLYMERGKVFEGIRHLEQAIRLKPDYPSPYLNLGLCFESLGRLKDAEKQYRNALRLQPGSSEALTNLGKLYLRWNAFEKAEHYLVLALESKPDNAAALVNYAGLSYLKNEKEKAEKLYRQTLALDERDADAWSSLGFLLAEKGQLTEAIGCFHKALELNPEHPQAKTNLARFSAMKGITQ